MTELQASPLVSTTPSNSDAAVDAINRPPVHADLDTALRDIGLAPVKAWIPDLQAKQLSATAKRTRKSRDKAVEQGLKQISITMPIELHPLARELAARTRAGEPATQVLDALKMTISESEPLPPNAMPATITPVPPIVFGELSAWRRWLIGLLLPTEVCPLLGLQALKAPKR